MEKAKSDDGNERMSEEELQLFKDLRNKAFKSGINLDTLEEEKNYKSLAEIKEAAQQAIKKADEIQSEKIRKKTEEAIKASESKKDQMVEEGKEEDVKRAPVDKPKLD